MILKKTGICTALCRSIFEPAAMLPQSAELLNIHRTSMMKRLNRIKKLTGIRLENADTRLYLMLSYKNS